MVTVELGIVIFPSITPSTNRSSVPVTSPLILIPWLMQAGAFAETVCAAPKTVPCFPGPVVFTELEGALGDACGLPSSLRHMGTPQTSFSDFQSRLSWAGLGPRLRISYILQRLGDVKCK